MKNSSTEKDMRGKGVGNEVLQQQASATKQVTKQITKQSLVYLGERVNNPPLLSSDAAHNVPREVLTLLQDCRSQYPKRGPYSS